MKLSLFTPKSCYTTGMKTLHIYPTSRAIRKERLLQREENALLPSLIRIDNFEREAILLPERRMVDPLQRMLILQEASHFEGFQMLKINRDLVKFFTKSDAIFKFFEELSQEKVGFHELVEGDAYVEFGEHIDVLEELLANYKTLLDARGLTDRVFIPSTYRINQGFIDAYDGFELHLEGYLSYFELELIEKISQQKTFIIRMHTSKFNQKVQERFLEMGVELPNNSYVSFDLKRQKILSQRENRAIINAKVFFVEERLAQIPPLFESVQSMVDSGISPNEIVVILPDESFKESVKLFDRFNNFNFAMGFNYDKGRAYKSLDAIHKHLKSFSEETLFLLRQYKIDPEEVNRINPKLEVNAETFFTLIEPFEVEKKSSMVEESLSHFKNVFKKENMSVSAWLFLWLKQLSKLTIDDVRGGKVTVMGALETRGVSFKGVVILDFNDGIVPNIPSKDAFLNSSLRKFAGLPTKNDREALQKQIYKRLLEQAEESVILYSTSNNKAPASYLYELGLGLGKEHSTNLALLYNEPNQVVVDQAPVIENFNAQEITWSATRLKIFLTCKRRYYYTYIERLKPKREEDINEGRFLHKLLEHLFKEKESYHNIKEIASNFDRLLDELLEDNSAKVAYSKLLWKAKMEKFLASQIDYFRAGWRVIEREKETIGTIQGIKFKGVVDRIDQEGSNQAILDYKSGSIIEANRLKNLEKLTDFQMSIYHELLKESYPNLRLFFVEIFNGKMTEIAELEAKTKRLHEIIEELKETHHLVAEKCENTTACLYCDYTLLCERGVYL